jgi:serine-type D-Ala-D-Ala carboxypeptidase/endopeptidase
MIQNFKVTTFVASVFAGFATSVIGAEPRSFLIAGDAEIHKILFRDGGTLGYASAMAWDPKNRAGAVVLCNQIGDVADIARHLLRPDFPLTKQVTRKHNEIALDSSLLDSYTGRYEAKGEGIFTIARDGDFLTMESPSDWGLPKLRVRPESQRDFFAASSPSR